MVINMQSLLTSIHEAFTVTRQTIEVPASKSMAAAAFGERLRAWRPDLWTANSRVFAVTDMTVIHRLKDVDQKVAICINTSLDIARWRPDTVSACCLSQAVAFLGCTDLTRPGIDATRRDVLFAMKTNSPHSRRVTPSYLCCPDSVVIIVLSDAATNLQTTIDERDTRTFEFVEMKAHQLVGSFAFIFGLTTRVEH